MHEVTGQCDSIDYRVRWSQSGDMVLWCAALYRRDDIVGWPTGRVTVGSLDIRAVGHLIGDLIEDLIRDSLPLAKP